MGFFYAVLIMKKLLKGCLIGCLGSIILACVIFLFITLMLSLFSSAEKDYKRRQNEYFAKVDYTFTGDVGEFDLLGGTYCIVEIDYDTLNISKNQIGKEDAFCGIYNEKDSKIYCFCKLPEKSKWSESIYCEKTDKIEDLRIKVDSKKRKVYYLKNNKIDSTILSDPDVYQSDLSKLYKRKKNYKKF